MHSRAYLLLQKDLLQAQKEPLKGIRCRPVSEDNLYRWEASISGLSDTPWEGGIFKLSLMFDHSYNTRPPSIWFTTVPFHPNVHPDTGVPCCGLLQSGWGEEHGLQSLLLYLQCLLSQPDTDDGCIMNLDAARILWDSPHAYRQIALDCVVASLRIDAGLPPFPGEGEVEKRSENTSSSSLPLAVNVGSERTASTSSRRRKLSAKAKPTPISFDDYYALWKGIATSQPKSKNRKNPMYGVLVKDPALTKAHLGADPSLGHSELEKRLDQHQMLKYGHFKAPSAKEQAGTKGGDFKDKRIAELRDMYKTAILAPELGMYATKQSPPREKQPEEGGLSVQHWDGLSDRDEADHVTGGGGVDVDDLLQWTRELDNSELHSA